MPEIIPSILVNTLDEVKEKIAHVENYVNWVQLDVADGDFAPSVSWGDPRELKYYDPGVFIEAHLMITKPEKVIDDWIKSGVKRIYYHWEATSVHEEIIGKIKEAKLEAGVALLQDTPIDVIAPVADTLDAVLLFSGTLGFYGGQFNEDVMLPRIKALHERWPALTIEVDGGMNPDTAPKAVVAGAELIISGSYIWNSDNKQQAIEELRRVVSGAQ